MGALFNRQWLDRLFGIAMGGKLLDWSGAKRGKHYRTSGAGAAHGQHRPGGSRYRAATGPGSYAEESPQQAINRLRRERDALAVAHNYTI